MLADEVLEPVRLELVVLVLLEVVMFELVVVLEELFDVMKYTPAATAMMRMTMIIAAAVVEIPFLPRLCIFKAANNRDYLSVIRD